MNTKRRIALLSNDPGLHKHLELRMQSKGHQVISLPEPAQVLGYIYADPPDIVIFDFSIPNPQFHEVLTSLKLDSYFSVIPMIGLISESAVESFSWDQYPLDDFVAHPVKYPELFSRIMLSLQRIQRIFDNNPLTKLPGNASIQQAIVRALGEPLAVCYLDINNFKPYNDKYGFSRGDEVLRMVARIMTNAVRESPEGGFAGHIGGDDFVFISPVKHVEQVCKTLIANFNIIVSEVFGEEDNARGFYIAKDRKGEVQKIPLLGIAIAVVPADNPMIEHAAKIVEVATELKKLAKKSETSCYVIDRRRT
jgi:GGDEF domain-containing protein